MTTRVLVLGATGTQGQAVARHLLARGRFAVRALTRRPRSTPACALELRGAEVVEGDFASRSSLRAALRGCQAVFGAARYPGAGDRPYILGLNLINAVAGSAVDHFVLSDRHGTFEAYARSLQLPASYIRPGLYFERISAAFDRARDLRLSGTVCVPGRPLIPGVAVDDVGGLVASLLERPAESIDRRLAAVGDCRSPQAYALAWMRQIRRPPGDAAPGLPESPFPDAETFWDQHSEDRDDHDCDATAARAIYPGMKDSRPGFVICERLRSEHFYTIRLEFSA